MDTQIYSKLIEGQYPKYENVIPIDNDKRLTASKNELSSAVKRVSIFSNAYTHQIRFAVEGEKLKISSEDVEYGGEANEELNIKYEADDIEVAYNGVYVLDLLKHIDTDEVNFLMKDSVSAAIVTPSTQKEKEDFMMLIMPIRLSED